jgi:hypothetical protein
MFCEHRQLGVTNFPADSRDPSSHVLHAERLGVWAEQPGD